MYVVCLYNCITLLSFFFFNDTATTEIYTLSLHDALPIWRRRRSDRSCRVAGGSCDRAGRPRSPSGLSRADAGPRSEEHTSELQHANISYAVFCLKKKKYRRGDHKYLSRSLCTEFEVLDAQ